MSDPRASIASLTDPQIVAVTLYGEARGEPIEGQIAVGCVLRNRYHTGRWGSSYAKVCLAPWQFSCWQPEGGRANYDEVLALARELATATVVPENALFRQCAWIAHGIIGEWICDTVRDATHYYAPDAMVPAGAVPKWAANKRPAVTIGRHLFFAQVA